MIDDDLLDDVSDEDEDDEPAEEGAPAPLTKKKKPWGAVSGRKRKRGRKRQKGNRKTIKNWAWAAVAIRVEHYGFLRELRAYYDNESFAKIVGTLIIDEYCKILHTVDPVKATAIRKAYQSEKYKHEVIELDGRR